jgi:DNA polymerase III subunit delta
MKLDARTTLAFLRNPGTTRCVLLHGEDTGLIRERADLLAHAVAPPDDPFRTAILERTNHARLAEEAAALSMTGGRRVVRVHDANDALLKTLLLALSYGGDTLIVLEAPDIDSRSKLRLKLEALPDAAVIGCYPEEGRNLEATIRAGLQTHGVVAEPDALAFLTRQLGADRAVTLSEIEKLTLLAGDGGRITLEDALACVGDAASLSVDDALYSATAGDASASDRALNLALNEGATPVGLLRMAQSHLQKLHRARLAMEEIGLAAEASAASLRPPIFYRRLPAFLRALRIWPADCLLRAIQAMVTAEQGCKRTNAPDDAICRDAIANLARGAGSLERMSTGKRIIS